MYNTFGLRAIFLLHRAAPVKGTVYNTLCKANIGKHYSQSSMTNLYKKKASCHQATPLPVQRVVPGESFLKIQDREREIMLGQMGRFVHISICFSFQFSGCIKNSNLSSAF